MQAPLQVVVQVEFWAYKPLEYGQHLKLAGSAMQMGAWDPRAAPGGLFICHMAMCPNSIGFLAPITPMHVRYKAFWAGQDSAARACGASAPDPARPKVRLFG